MINLYDVLIAWIGWNIIAPVVFLAVSSGMIFITVCISEIYKHRKKRN
jgi:CRISPR/Cas system CMR subunit Cmr6 (Cas7 group RAMP superfamily)